MNKQEQFRDIARETAKIILENSWEENNVKGVLGYGSTWEENLQRDPNDIDLLILHLEGIDLKNYTTSRSKFTSEEEKAGEEVHYFPSTAILNQLGYIEGGRDVMSKVHSLFKEEGMLTEEDFQDWFPPTIDSTLDLHVLNTHMFRDPSFMGEKHKEFYERRLSKLRKEAIEMSGKDPNFFHRVFNNGRLYDPTTGDFTKPFEESYPGALDLFPSSE